MYVQQIKFGFDSIRKSHEAKQSKANAEHTKKERTFYMRFRRRLCQPSKIVAVYFSNFFIIGGQYTFSAFLN